MTMRPLARLGVMLLLATAATMVSPSRATACSCASFRVARPTQDATEVPRNARIWVTNHTPSSVQPAFDGQLIGPEGAVALDTGHLLTMAPPGDVLYVFTPREPLRADAEYRLSWPAGGITEHRFRTGRALDEAPPRSPKELGRTSRAERTPYSTCGDSYQIVTATVDWDDNDFLMVHLAPSAAPPPAPLPTATFPPTNGPYAAALRPDGDNHIHFGSAFCATPWPSGFTVGQLWYGALDGAGNFSGWTAAGRIELPALPTPPAQDGAPQAQDGAPQPQDRAPQPGCNVARPTSVTRPGVGGGLALLALAALVALAKTMARRRRPR